MDSAVRSTFFCPSSWRLLNVFSTVFVSPTFIYYPVKSVKNKLITQNGSAKKEKRVTVEKANIDKTKVRVRV